MDCHDIKDVNVVEALKLACCADCPNVKLRDGDLVCTFDQPKGNLPTKNRFCVEVTKCFYFPKWLVGE
jgi:hypothetical protein